MVMSSAASSGRLPRCSAKRRGGRDGAPLLTRMRKLAIGTPSGVPHRTCHHKIDVVARVRGKARAERPIQGRIQQSAQQCRIALRELNLRATARSPTSRRLGVAMRTAREGLARAAAPGQ
eukprot:5154158-Heterocapsa_arctica.AAC.1